MDTTLVSAARIADDIEAAAYRDMYAAVPENLATHLGLRTMQIDDATLLMAQGVADPVFARAIGVGNDGRADPELVDRVLGVYRAARIAPFWIHVNPVLAPRELIGILEARGLVPAKRRTWAKMLRNAGEVPGVDSPLIVRHASPRQRIATSTAIAIAFGMPPPFARWIENLALRPDWTMVTALDGERVVGGGLLYIQGTAAWLGLGGVLAEARRRNAHRAILAERIAHAISRGCTHIATETGEPINSEPNPSLRNMYRLGFERVASRLNYVATK